MLEAGGFRSMVNAATSPDRSVVGEPLSVVDLAGFRDDLEDLRRETFASLSTKDFKHLQKIEGWGRLASLFGYLTAWTFPNVISAFLLSTGQFTRWLLAHHILHKGYDRVPGIPDRYTSKHFARGWRRFIDWFDWIHPTAWDHEHNSLHHYHTGEDADPDLTERYLEYLRALKIPRFFKYCFIGLASISWKYTYYAPNTASVIDPDSKRRLRHEHIAFITIKNILDLRNPTVRALWRQSYLPYGVFHFAIIPLLFLPLGESAVWAVLINKVIAECLTNLHSFIVVTPNHTANDLYRYGFHYERKEQFYVTQVLGTANYRTGTEFIDYWSVWLNYQIEHHLFPDLPMTKYREIQPKVRALCEKHGIPYLQEPIFKRVGKMLDICVGATSMRNMEAFPEPLYRTPLSSKQGTAA